MDTLVEQRRSALDDNDATTKELDDLRARLPQLTARYQIRERKNIEERIQQLEQHLATVSERKAHFEARVQPYVEKLHALRDQAPVATIGVRINATSKAEKQLLREYITSFEDDMPIEIEAHQPDTCKSCQQRMQLHSENAILVCGNCGNTEQFVDSIQSFTSYGGDNASAQSNYSYLRVSHFEDWIAKSQGLETTQVSEELLQQIMEDMYKHGVRSEASINRHTVRKSLARLGQQRKYDHVVQITSRLTNKAPPRMTPQMEEECRVLFLAVQSVWTKIRDKISKGRRKNFMSYSYILHRFMRMLRYDKFVPCYSLLKGEEKLQLQDAFWAEICSELGWEVEPR